MKREYNIGLDIGTTSVGWAVVETNNQKIMKKGGKRLWGVRLFDEAKTAAERRSYRSARRRYDRRRERINLLQREFCKEINKVDIHFYDKLKESFFGEDDIVNKKNPLSIKEKMEILKYNKKNPTIYHLRNELAKSSEKQDIRLVYLAIHHIIKYRGNFLYNINNFNVNNLNIEEKLKNVFLSIIDTLPEYDVQELDKYVNINKLAVAILNQSKNDRKIFIKKELEDSFTKEFINEFIKMINGNKFDFVKMLAFDLKDKITISFDGTEYDDKYSELEILLGDSIELLDELKQLYDIVFLRKLFKGSCSSTISSLMVEKYNNHKNDLKFLKSVFAKNRKIYDKLFRTKDLKNPCLYDLYINNKVSNNEFVNEVGKYLSKVFDIDISKELLDEYEMQIKPKMMNGKFMPRVTDSDNGKYPYQLNKEELIKIIENQGKYYPFLLNKTKDGKYKIVKLLEFRIPYYVGPLTNEKNSKFAWMVKKVDNQKITPYNFDEIVDKALTAEKFIKRMISHCTYLWDEPAMPSNSILYSKYKVLNELKQIRINGDAIGLDAQHNIYNNLFLKTTGSITDKVFRNYIHGCSDFDMYQNMDITITGYSDDKKFANNMQSYVDFFGQDGIFRGTKYTEEDAEIIIEWITIFEDKDILEQKICDTYFELNEYKIQNILHKRYKGWSNLSKKLLTIKFEKVNSLEKNSIMDLMYDTKDNFMQIINNYDYKFQDMISSLNKVENISRTSYKLIDNLATSPATKRGIYQSLKIVDEIVKYMGNNPKTIMIEMARGNEKKQRKDDKKTYLLKLYDKFKDDIDNYNQLMKELNNYDSYQNLNVEKLFLYFIQEGKSLYSGRTLNIDDLKDYEVDHIIPRTLIKDDSIDNKALVFREENQIKAANYVLPSDYRSKSNIIWWSKLRKTGLMSPKKFYNLCRVEYKEDDIDGFINRQLVETRQITKHVANILGNCYDNVKIIYLPASLSHNYREKYELFKFRDINDYHHAHDAYLAAVLGEYQNKYLKKNISFDLLKQMNQTLYKEHRYKEMKYGYVINSLDSELNEYNVLVIDKKTGKIIFNVEDFNKKINDNLYCNDILVSRKTEIRNGMFYKETLYSKNIGKINIKEGLSPSMYGGYNNAETSYLMLIEYKNKKQLIGIPTLIVVKNNSILLDEYLKKQLKLKENDTYKILKRNIPFDTLVNFKNHDVYIKGYSMANNNCELSNAKQLKFTKKEMYKWKYTFNKILNNKNIPKDKNGYPLISDEELLNQAMDILKLLFDKKNMFPLFINYVIKIEKQIDYSKLNFIDISKIISELLKMYHCNSVNANLKEFNLDDRIGRLSGKKVDKGIIINNSVTGLKRYQYEF